MSTITQDTNITTGNNKRDSCVTFSELPDLIRTISDEDHKDDNCKHSVSNNVTMLLKHMKKLGQILNSGELTKMGTISISRGLRTYIAQCKQKLKCVCPNVKTMYILEQEQLSSRAREAGHL